MAWSSSENEEKKKVIEPVKKRKKLSPRPASRKTRSSVRQQKPSTEDKAVEMLSSSDAEKEEKESQDTNATSTFSVQEPDSHSTVSISTESPTNGQSGLKASDWVKSQQLKTPSKTDQSTVSCDVEDSARKKKKHSRGGLAEQLARLQNRDKSSVRVWKHQHTSISAAQDARSVCLEVIGFESLYSLQLIKCKTIKSDTECQSDVSPVCGETRLVMIPFSQAEQLKLQPGMKFKVYPPWKQLQLSTGQQIMLCTKYCHVLEQTDRMNEKVDLDCDQTEKTTVKAIWNCPCAQGLCRKQSLCPAYQFPCIPGYIEFMDENGPMLDSVTEQEAGPGVDEPLEQDIGDEAENESEDDFEDIDDSVNDSDYNPAESNADSDDGSVVINEDEKGSITRQEGDVGRSISGSEIDNKSALNPQLCPGKMLKVQGSNDNSKGNLNNKKHACLFCEKLFPNISRHMTNMHANEHDVSKILIKPVRSKERRNAWLELVNKGDFSHNYYTFEKGYGTVIPKYRSRSRKDDDDVNTLIPCQHCKGFYKKHVLLKHQKLCVVQKASVLPSNHIQAGKLLLPHKCAAELLHENVLFSLEKSKYNRPQLLSLVEDVVKINKHLEESSKSLCGDIKADPNKFYPHLAKVCLAQVILFNRKRSEEAQRMTVKGFLDAKSGGYIDDTIKGSLTLFEQKLCKSHLRMEIEGKKGRKVPVLLTEKMVFSLYILLKYRDLAGVSDNTLLFAKPGSAEHPYRGCDVLREFANCCNLKFPACITSTKLRKQLATVAQILNLKENDQDILTTFQGHDIRVHRQFYRLPASTLQVAKISKLLHCLNNGTISKYKGRDFDSIELEHGETVENDEESDESENDEESKEIHDRPDIDDIVNDSDYNPAESNVDSDDGSVVINEDEKGSITRQEADVGGSISGSEIDNESALNPQLCPEKMLKVQGSNENSKGNLNNKKHACLFCEKLFPNISRHMTNMHANEHDVSKILIKPVRSKERRNAWVELVNKGDFSHNYHAFEKGFGTVIPKYRSRSRKEDDDVKTLIPCQHCKGFYKKNLLWKHQKLCVVQKASVLPLNHIQAGKLLLPHKCATELLHENVLIKMKEDDVKLIVLGDKHILQHGNDLYEQKGHEIQQHAYISCKLRELGRLLLEAKCIDTNIKTLLELMIASNWDLLVTAVRKVAEYNKETHTFGIPSLARKLGHSLKKIAETEYFESLKNGNNETKSLTETFLQMYQLNWRKVIGSIAYSSLEKSKYNGPQLLSLVEDVVKINKHLEESSKSLCGDIKADPNKFYPHLAKVCLAQVILFNRKRSEEAQRMTVKGFLDAKSEGYIDDTIKGSLTLFEQTLCKSHLRMEIKGKKGRRVPVLLTEKMVFSLNILLKYRDSAGVSDNTLLFARPGSAEHPYRGCDVLREFANCCNLKFPACITSTKLRKQLATVAQILNLKENYKDIRTTFQEHDIRIHRLFYRLPESTLQVAKISKLLHCLNNGTISKYKGRDFDNIDLEHGETVENDEESDESENDEESEEIHDRPVDEPLEQDLGDEAENESEDDFKDIDDNVNDSDYNPAESNADSDDGSVVINEDEKGSITRQEADAGGSISGSEIDNESDLYPQLCPDKLLKVQGSNDNSKGNLNNKKHACLFCEKLFPNISRHMTNMHANEQDVSKILIKPVRSKERRNAWVELVNKGDFSHNYYAFEKGYGTVIPKYRSRSRKEDDDVKTLVPCQYCKGFYKKNLLWKHQKLCVVQKASVLPLNHIKAGKLLLPRKCSTEHLHKNVLIKMKEDDVKLIVLGDKHILQHGNDLYEQKSHGIQQHTYISCKLRELGRLLLEAKCIDTNIKTLLELMIASNWDLLIAAVRKVAEFNEETHTFGIPSLARKLGHSLKKIAETEYFESLKNGNNETKSLTETFLQMYQLNWRKAIGSIAYSSLEKSKYNRPQLLSLVEDVVKINKHLEESSKSLCGDIKADPNKFYPHLAKVCLAQVILFNRKRSEEAQRMTVKGFLDAKSGGYIDDTIKGSLTLFEQRLCKSHLRMEIKGKKGRRVPVLLTEKMVFGLNILLKYRDLAGVSDNTLLFARPGSAEHPYRGCDVLREFADCCNLKFPASITSTKLRKQLATIAQILNLKENDQDILTTFQGHDIRVHRQLYQLPESTLQVAKISKLLHCLNNGTISKYKGRDFDSIDLEHGETVENDEESDESENDEESEEIHDRPEIPAKKRTRDHASDQEYFPARKKSKGMKQRIYLTTQERETIAGAFRKEIGLQKVPGKLDVLNFMRKNTSFKKYSWTKVKFAVHNMITAIKHSSL